MQQKNISYILLSLLLLLMSCKEEIINFEGQNSANVTIEWQNSFGEKDFDEISEIIRTNDGGFIAIGSALSNDWNYWVLKFDSDLNLIWEKKYGGSRADFGKSIIETYDGNFVINGYSSSSDGNISVNNGNYDVWIAKIDVEGNIIWEKSYGGSGSEFVTEESLIKSKLGGYVFTATTNSNDIDVSKNYGGNDVWVVNINDSANIVWEKTYGGTKDDFSNRIKLTADSSYYLSNIVLSDDNNISFNYGGKDIWLFRINQLGDLLWQKNIGGSGTENQCDFTTTTDNGIILTLQTNSKDGDIQENYGFKDICYIKLDANGKIEWHKVFGGSLDEAVGDIKQLSDGSFVSVCKTSSTDYYIGFNYGKNDICAIKLNSGGELEWTKILGGSNDEYSNSLLEFSSNELLVAGVTNSEDYDIENHIGGFDFWLFKLQY